MAVIVLIVVDITLAAVATGVVGPQAGRDVVVFLFFKKEKRNLKQGPPTGRLGRRTERGARGPPGPRERATVLRRMRGYLGGFMCIPFKLTLDDGENGRRQLLIRTDAESPPSSGWGCCCCCVLFPLACSCLVDDENHLVVDGVGCSAWSSTRLKSRSPPRSSSRS